MVNIDFDAFYPRPWRVEYDQKYPSWHAQSLPHVVDANGTLVFNPTQHVRHPGLFDAIALGLCEHVVNKVNGVVNE